MAALIIVSLGMLAVIQAVSQTASNSAYLRDKTFAHWVAMNQLTTVRLAPQAPNTEDKSGDTEMAGQKWHWTMKVIQTPVQTMRRIDISVAAPGAPKNSALATVTGFYGTALLKTPSTMSWDGATGVTTVPQPNTTNTAPVVAPGSSSDQLGLGDFDSNGSNSTNGGLGSSTTNSPGGSSPDNTSSTPPSNGSGSPFDSN